jgi:Ca2+-binding EF-hand superfamily protein
MHTMTTAFNPKVHPDSMNGKSEEKVFIEFLENFEDFHRFYLEKTGNSNNAHMVTKDEWVQYFEILSLSINSDSHFETLINCFRLDGRDTGREKVSFRDAKLEESYSRSLSSKPKTSSKPTDSNILNQPHLNGRYSYNVSLTPMVKKSNINIISNERNQKDFIEIVRGKIIRKGVGSLINLTKQFKHFDLQNSSLVDFQRFQAIMKEVYSEILDKNDIETVFKFFDYKNCGLIYYEEFMHLLKGEMSPNRKKMVLHVFNTLDSDRKGFVYFEEMKEQFLAKNNIDVKSSNKSEEEVYQNFVEAFDFILSNKTKTRKDKVFYESFLEFYSFVSCTIDNDEYFSYLLNNSWNFNTSKQTVMGNINNLEINSKLNNSIINKFNLGPNYQPRNPLGISSSRARTDKSIEALPEIVPRSRGHLFASNYEQNGYKDTISNIRSQIVSRGINGIFGLIDSFKACDNGNTKLVDKIDFKKCLLLHRISTSLSDDEVEKLCEYYDIHKVSKVYYESFIKAVVGEINTYRKSLVRKLFSKFVKDTRNYIELEEFVIMFNPNGHPDINKKSDNEVFADFVHSVEFFYQTLVRFT